MSRRRRVSELLGQGLSVKVVAVRLGMTPNGVRYHMKMMKGGEGVKDESVEERGSASSSSSSIRWWAYLHTNGTVQLKRYYDPFDLVEAKESPFVQKVYGPFTAGSHHEAAEVARLQLLTSRKGEKGE